MAQNEAMEAWRAVDAYVRAVEPQTGALEGLNNRTVVADLHHYNEEQDPDPDTNTHPQ